MKHLFSLFTFLLICASALRAQDVVQMTQADVNALYQTYTRKTVSVHDPSVVHIQGKAFYVIGSHRGWATSTDNMRNWSPLNGDQIWGRMNDNGGATRCSFAEAFTTNATTKVVARVGSEKKEVAFGPFDAKAWANADQAGWDITGNMWAPDIIYNPNSEKWMMYMSLNGDAWHSVIVLLTADRITGPYVYQGPVHYSGFINGTNAAINWKKTDLEIVIGKQNSLPARYNKGGDWGTWWTNDIDPCVFFDEEGELWMTYGSWSGGIFIIRLDKQTGLRDYTYTYETKNDGKGRALSDPYFGKRIAGGYYSSGEGSYIQHIGDYYYLFMSYGGFAPDGGYEMRLFRSATPDGVYVDANNLDACYHDRYWLNFGPNAQTNGGMKLLGAYNGWGLQTVGECAQGHNSATADAAGRNFVVYHTKFNNGTAWHEVRVRQLFLNRDGWPCAAPFQFDGETVNDDSIATGCHYAKETIPGTYDVLIHRYKLNHEKFEEVTPVSITLTENGRIEGDLTGTWSMTDGTAYISLKTGQTTYNGVVVPQTLDGTTLRAIGITAQAKNGVSLWAFRLEPRAAVAYAVKNYTFPVKNNQSVNRHLPLAAYKPKWGATMEWTSSHPDIISNTGEYNPADEDTPVTLTCRISAGRHVYEQAFNVRAQHATDPGGDIRTGLVAYYDFESRTCRNAYDTSQSAYLGHAGNGRTPEVVADATRYGNVLSLWAGAVKTESYARLTNPLKGRTDMDGLTVALSVRRADADDIVGTLWSITDKQGASNSVTQRLFMTGNAYLGFETPTVSLAVNEAKTDPITGKPLSPTGYIPAEEWVQLTTVISAADGISIFVNGTKKAHKTFASADGTNARNFDYSQIIQSVAEAGFIQLGVGGKAGSAEALFDDILVYDRALTPTDVRTLYTLAGRTTDFGPNGTNGINYVNMSVNRDGESSNCKSSSCKSYDLSGRSASPSYRGIVVRQGRKLIK